jgi:hypothetical protein
MPTRRRHQISAAAMLAAILPAWIGGTSCDSTAPGNGGPEGGLALVTTTAGIQPMALSCRSRGAGSAWSIAAPVQRRTVPRRGRRGTPSPGAAGTGATSAAVGSPRNAADVGRSASVALTGECAVRVAGAAR